MTKNEMASGLTSDEVKGYLKDRKEAAAMIDIETCELLRRGIDEGDPYGVQPERAWGQYGSALFVGGPNVDGWIWEGDLPKEKITALYDRLTRDRQREILTALNSAAESGRGSSDVMLYGQHAVHHRDWQAECDRLGIRVVVKRERLELLEAGLIGCQGDYSWVARKC